MPPPTDAERRERRRRERERERARRGRLAILIAAAVIAAVAGALIGSGGGDGDDEAPATASAPPPACPAEVGSDLERLVGQMLVVRMEGSATDGLKERARRGEIGGVVLFPPATAPAAGLRKEIRSLRRAAQEGGSVAPLVMIDQEGGEVERLPGRPPDRAPAELAAASRSASLAEGRATGRSLARLGIDVDLAPVLDVAASPQAFIGSRAFGSVPAAVALRGTAFGEGLEAAGVAATAKHFPGLGLATVNTDLAPSAIDASRSELRPGLEPFEAAIEAGFGLVMASNAVYVAYDAERPASQSPRIIDGLLRRRLGFDGVVVTDDLGAGALVQAGIDEGEAAVGAAAAGADLLLFALSDANTARAALQRAVRHRELDRADLRESCARTTALRERLASSPASR